MTRTFEIAIAIHIMAAAGCDRGPQLAKENQQFADTVYTAVAARNQKWLESNERIVAEAHDTHRLSDEEFDALNEILQLARSGDWTSAAREAKSLLDSQRPREETVNDSKGKTAVRNRGPKTTRNLGKKPIESKR